MRIQLAALLLVPALALGGAARAADSDAPVITHTPLTAAPTGPIQVTARITDESKIFPQVFHRYDGKPFELPIDMKKVKGTKDQYEATIPFQEGPLDYYIECYDEFGNGPARAGSLEQPFHLMVGEGKPATAAPVTEAPGTTAPQRTAALPPKSAPLSVPTVSEVERAKVDANLASPAAPPLREPQPEAPSASLATHLNEPAAPLTARDALWRSALLPGWGQFRTDRKLRSALFGGATAAALIATIWMSARAAQANNIYESAPPLAQPAARQQAWSYARGRNWAIGLTIGVWTANAVESYFGFGTHD